MSAVPKLPTDPGARHIRRMLKPRAALALRRGADAAGATYEQLGLAVDLPKQRVGRMATAAHPDVLDVVRARMAPPEVAKAIASFVVEPHGAIVEDAPPCEHGDNHAARLCALTCESTDVLRELSAALVDGVISADELDRVERELHGNLRATREALSWVVAARVKARGEGTR